MQLTRSRGLNERKSGWSRDKPIFQTLWRSVPRRDLTRQRDGIPPRFSRANRIYTRYENAGIAKSWRPPLFPRYILKDVHVHHWGNAPLSTFRIEI